MIASKTRKTERQRSDSYIKHAEQLLAMAEQELISSDGQIISVKGLKKLKMTDAAFIWTEPHSKRLKIRVTVQKEYSGTMLEKT